MQSSMHILQETVKGMQDELKECYVRIRDYEYKEDDWKQVKDRMDSLKTNLIDENAELKSQLTGISLFFVHRSMIFVSINSFTYIHTDEQ